MFGNSYNVMGKIEIIGLQQIGQAEPTNVVVRSYYIHCSRYGICIWPHLTYAPFNFKNKGMFFLREVKIQLHIDYTLLFACLKNCRDCEAATCKVCQDD